MKHHKKNPSGSVLSGMVDYRKILDPERPIKKQGIQEKIIIYNGGAIVTGNPVWHFINLIKQVTPNFVQFSKLSPVACKGL